MIRKKGNKGKAAKATFEKKEKKSRPKGRTRTKKAANAAEVRNDIAKIVKSGAKKIAQAVMSQAMTGQLAPAKYLLEVAGVYPPVTDGTEATAEEECLAKTLLRRLDIPDEPISHDDEDELPTAKGPEEDGMKARQNEKDGGESDGVSDTVK